MALPSSGQISFNDVRVEMSQSLMAKYSMYRWIRGFSFLNGGDGGLPNQEPSVTFTPINILSSGSRWDDTDTASPKKMEYTNYSMSAWYQYNHLLYVNTNATGTLYNHIKQDSDRSRTMLPMYIGTNNKVVYINVSGSLINDVTNKLLSSANITVWYGKPWSNDGSYVGSHADLNIENGLYDNSMRQYITGSLITIDPLEYEQTASINMKYLYNYTYDSVKGEYLYVVLEYRGIDFFDY